MGLMQNWLLLAVLAPTFWAIGCLVDSCLISQEIYKAPSDGAVVSGLFCLLPVLLVLGVDAHPLTAVPGETDLPISAIAAGLAYTFHLFFYFRTLYCLNDVSGAETFLSLSVLIVPFFAWVLLDEVLPTHYYVAFLIAAAGVLLQCLPVIVKVGLPMLTNLVLSVVAVSLSMVLQSHALTTHGFTVATAGFNLTCFSFAAFLVIINKQIRRRIVVLFRSYPAVLIASEVLGLLAVLSLHRATQFAPSVSIVALIECLLPLIIIAISFLLISANRYAPLLSDRYQMALVLQVQSVPSKMAALFLMVISLASLSF